MASIFAELQMLSQMEKENTVIDTRKQMNKILEFMEHRPNYEETINTFATYVRFLKPETLKAAHGFMVQDLSVLEIPEELRHDSLGFVHGNRLVFDGRFVYPVFDVKGDVMGWCGYDKFEDPKYLDSLNHGYKAKAYSVYGEEKLPDYYKSDDIVVFPEGIVCCLCLREADIQSCALLGSQISPYVLEILKRFGKRAIVMMDADEAGTQLRKRLHYLAPDIRVAQSRVAKDIDDSRQLDPTFMDEVKKLRNPFYRSPLFK